MASHHTLISKGTRIIGDIQFNGDVHIQGHVVGTIVGDANAELEICQGGLVEGQVQLSKIVIRGVVKGDIQCLKHIELAATCVIHGNVYYNVIEMVKGAQVNGNLIHVSEEELRARMEANNVGAATE